MKTRTILAIVIMAGLTQTFNMVNAAQKKEDPNYAPIAVQVDAQKKEDPNYRPAATVSERFRAWLASWIVSTDAQKKE